MSATDSEYDEWLRSFASRNEVAEWYAHALEAFSPSWKGWEQTNQAIVRRWSISGLGYIKRQAWKLATEMGLDLA